MYCSNNKNYSGIEIIGAHLVALFPQHPQGALTAWGWELGGRFRLVLHNRQLPKVLI